jgi:hypothetical protein
MNTTVKKEYYNNANSKALKGLAHQFHLVDNSQLPIVTAISVMLLVMGIVFY